MLAEEWGRESCSFVLLSHVFLSFCLKKSFCLILKNIKISLLVFSVTLRSITFATDKEHQLRLKSRRRGFLRQLQHYLITLKER